MLGVHLHCQTSSPGKFRLIVRVHNFVPAGNAATVDMSTECPPVDASMDSFSPQPLILTEGNLAPCVEPTFGNPSTDQQRRIMNGVRRHETNAVTSKVPDRTSHEN